MSGTAGDWYSARLLYEFVHDPPEAKPKPLFEESLIVFQVDDADSVLGRLLELARGKEDNYEAAAGNQVYYTFREVLEVQDIGEKIEDCTEVFFRFWDNPGPRAFKMMRETHREPWWLEGST